MKEAEYYAAIEAAGHLLKRDPVDGSIKYEFREGYHGGPVCELCYHSWCQHCPDEIEPCRVGVIDSVCEVVGDTKALTHDGSRKAKWQRIAASKEEQSDD